MRSLLTFLALTLLVGCHLREGHYVEGLPKLRDPLPASTHVYLPRPFKGAGLPLHGRAEKMVTDAFAQVLKAHAIKVTLPEDKSGEKDDIFKKASEADADVVAFVSVKSWEYNDAGFSGFGARDEVVLAITWVEVARRRVLARADVFVDNGFGRSSVGGDKTEVSLVPALDHYIKDVFK